MQWYDWLIVLLPLSFVLWMGYHVGRYAKSNVANFLVAGRMCGRYLLSVGDVANALSIIGILAYVEVHYKTGFALGFWSHIMQPLGILLSLTGYCWYRFRETRAMSLGQFLEMRYSRRFRIFAAALRSVSEMLANMIMPALAARFFIYFLDLPRYIKLAGFQISTFSLIMIIVLTMAIFIIYVGGTLSIVITDSLQGMILYPLLVIFVIYVLSTFSWDAEIIPVMSDRLPGESFLNPFDISKLRDFNLFFLLVTFLATILHRASWIGAGSSSSARSPHEQKMAGLLGTWRNSIVAIFYILTAVIIITVMNHKDFAVKAQSIRNELSGHIIEEMFHKDQATGEELSRKLQALPPFVHNIGIDPPMGDAKNLDTQYLSVVHETLKSKENGNALFQEFRTLYYQLSYACSIRQILPHWMLGILMLLLILAMLSTDDSRIFSAAITITQDVVMPLHKKEITPEKHIQIVRYVSIGIGIFFFLGSTFMAQLDYINLFTTIVCTMWMGGCGPVMIFGLYSRFGTTAGAWTSLLTGMFMALGGVALQRNWADIIYPWLDSHNYVNAVGHILEKLSGPFNPYIVWKMDPVKFPINSYEIYFITMVVTLVLYCIVSWLTCREPFNLDRMLHRGKYAIQEDGDKQMGKWSLKTIFTKLIGVTPEYTFWDKIIAYGVFFYSFIYSFIGTFIIVFIWNAVSPWPEAWWSHYFLVVSVVIPCIVAAVTTFWFGWGGIKDMIQMFRDLKIKTGNPLDNGSVEGHVSIVDQARFDEVEQNDEQKNQESGSRE